MLELHGAEGAWNQNGVICNAIVEAHGRYHLIGGRDNPQGEWVMGLFSSNDLEHWDEHPGNPILVADGERYVKGPNAIHLMHPAWRDPCVVRWDDGWFHCFVCARRPRWDHTSTGAVIGHLRSKDLVTWEPLPPIASVGERLLFAEVPSYFRLNGRSYLTFLDMGWGGTRIHTPSRSNASGTFYLVSDTPEGPYEWPRDPLLLGADDHRLVSWAAKVVELDGELLLYGHVASPKKRASLGLTKKIVECEPGVLQARYAGHLGALEQAVLLDSSTAPTPARRPHDSGIWHRTESDGLAGRADACGTSAIVHRAQTDFHLDLSATLTRGACAGVVMRATECEERFLINGAPPVGIAVMLDYERRMIELRGVSHVPMHGWGFSFMEARRHGSRCVPRQQVRCPLERGRNYHLRCIVRAEFFEVYLDDAWIITMALADAPNRGNIELIVERGEAMFGGIRLATLAPLE